MCYAWGGGGRTGPLKATIVFHHLLIVAFYHVSRHILKKYSSLAHGLKVGLFCNIYRNLARLWGPQKRQRKGLKGAGAKPKLWRTPSSAYLFKLFHFGSKCYFYYHRFIWLMTVEWKHFLTFYHWSPVDEQQSGGRGGQELRAGVSHLPPVRGFLLPRPGTRDISGWQTG